MGTVHIGGNGLSISYFADSGPDGERLTAAVVVRGREAGMQPNPKRGPISLRQMHFLQWRMRWEMRLRLVGMILLPHQFGAPRGFDGFTGNGKDRVAYSRSLRMVRVRGTDYPLPTEPGAMLVVLVDERDQERRVLVHSIASPPPRLRPPVDPAGDKQQMISALSQFHRATTGVWQAALHADPVVREFVEAR